MVLQAGRWARAHVYNDTLDRGDGDIRLFIRKAAGMVLVIKWRRCVSIVLGFKEAAEELIRLGRDDDMNLGLSSDA